MTSIMLTVTGAQAWATVTGPLTSGMVGIPVTIEYDDSWKGLIKNLVCRCSEWGSDNGDCRAILNVEDAAVVAHEVMKSDMYLYLGIEGFSPDGQLVIPTTWAACGIIQNGAHTEADPSADPTPSVWNQLQAEMAQIKQTAVEASNQAAVNADTARAAADSAQSFMNNTIASASTAADLADETHHLKIAAEDAALRAERAVSSLQDVPIDPTLTQSGAAADAKAAGDAIRKLDSHLFVDAFELNYTEATYTVSNGKAVYNNSAQTGGVWDCVVLDAANRAGDVLDIVTYTDRNRPLLFVDAGMNVLQSAAPDTGNPNLKYQISVTVPENAKQLIINHYKANSAGGDVGVTGYRSAAFASREELALAQESIMSLVRRNITPVIPVNNRVPVTDENVPVYLDNMFMGISPGAAALVSVNDVRMPVFDRKVVLLTHENITGQGSASIRLHFRDDTQHEVSKAISYDKAYTKTGAKKVLFIGDSITENQSYLAPLKALSDGGDYKITFLGTLGPDGLKNEGRGGWAAYNYATNDLSGMSTNKTNAFWDGSAFSFSHYMNSSGIDVPDYIFINLGTNDQIRGITNTSDDEEVKRVILSSYETMIDSIRAYSSGIPIVLWLPPTRSMIGRNNHAAIDKSLKVNKLLIDKFDTTTYMNKRVYLMPTYLFVNPYTDYPSFTTVIDGVEYQDGTEAIHPTASGGEKIARGILRQMMYIDGLIQG